MFVRRGYEWSIAGEHRVPTQKEIEEFVQKAVDELAGHPNLTQMEFGRLIVKNNGSFCDIYVHVAEVER